jgi:hypothetical protein
MNDEEFYGVEIPQMRLIHNEIYSFHSLIWDVSSIILTRKRDFEEWGWPRRVLESVLTFLTIFRLRRLTPEVLSIKLRNLLRCGSGVILF